MAAMEREQGAAGDSVQRFLTTYVFSTGTFTKTHAPLSDHDHDDDHDNDSAGAGALGGEVRIRLPHLAHAANGAVSWPSSEALAAFVHAHPRLVAGRHVVEIGAGTCLPGMVAAKLGARTVTLTDHHNASGHVEENAMLGVRLNGLMGAKGSTRVRYGRLTWGHFDRFSLAIAEGEGEGEGDGDGEVVRPLVVLGADCLYHSEDFSDVLCTVCFLLSKAPGSVFVTTYHCRSANHTIQHLLGEYGMEVVMETGWDGGGAVHGLNGADLHTFVLALAEHSVCLESVL